MSTILISTFNGKLRHRELIQGHAANDGARIPAQAAWSRAGTDNYYFHENRTRIHVVERVAAGPNPDIGFKFCHRQTLQAWGSLAWFSKKLGYGQPHVQVPNHSESPSLCN